jgi:hypothetical protein
VGKPNASGWFYAQTYDPTYPRGEDTLGLGLLFKVNHRNSKNIVTDMIETFGFKIPETPLRELPDLMSARQVGESVTASWMAAVMLLGQRLFVDGDDRYSPDTSSIFITQAQEWTNVMEFSGPAFRVNPQATFGLNVHRDDSNQGRVSKSSGVFPHRARFDVRFIPWFNDFETLQVQELIMPPDAATFFDPIKKARQPKLLKGASFEEAAQMFVDALVVLLADDPKDPLAKTQSARLRINSIDKRYYSLYDANDKLIGELILTMNEAPPSRSGRGALYKYPAVIGVSFGRI